MKGITLWTLNQSYYLLKDTATQNELCKLVEKKFGVPCEFGDRTQYHRDEIDAEIVAEQKSCLMFEFDPQYDEYFVPLSIKCLGSLYNEPLPHIDKIKEYESSIGRNDYTHFWDKEEQNEIGTITRMATKDYMGYYQILLEEKEKKDHMNILIGYSQGGLLARYLAWLDEAVFQKNAIKGIITMASPNFGSPMANPDNKENIVDTLLNIVLTLGDITEFPVIRGMAESLVNFEDVMDFLDSQSEMMEKKGDVAAKSNIDSFRKWLGGLISKCDNAFFDLNCKTIDNEGSVLFSATRPLTKVQYSSIITANSNVDEVAFGFFPLDDKLTTIMKTIIALSPLGRKLKRIQHKWYRRMLMEKSWDLPSLMREKQHYYTKGRAKDMPVIGRFAHDFFMPAAYQALPSYGDNFIGNFVNPFADHNSGKNINLPGGRQNYEYIKAILKKMAP